MGQRLSVSIISSLGSPVKPDPSLLPQAGVSERISDRQPESGTDADRLVPVSKPAEFPEPEPTHSDALLPEVDQTPSPPEREPIQEKESTPPPASKEAAPKPASRAPVAKKVEAKQEVLPFEPVSRGRFDKSEPTIVDGQDLDVPTFLRKHKFR
jgi:cell division protein FtsZ